MTRATCPDIGNWQALLEDGTGADEPAELVSHLETCADCRHTLESLAADPTAWEDAACGLEKQARKEPALQAVVERLRHEDPLAAEDDLSFLRPADKPGLLGMLGPYEVEAEIGRGGMGIVLKARDPALDRVVALKVLAPHLAASATARRRFIREGRSAAAVCHDHVVTVYHVNEADGLPYLVMQYVAGESLQERLDRAGPLEIEEVVRAGAQTASGLAAAHARGLIHRDIKPANLLLEDSRVKITDFGLARMTDDVQLTQNGVLAGTPQYMAPEQARGEAVDHRADLFSLGSVLYALGTGVAPFRGPTTLALIRQVCEETPTPMHALNPDVPDWLETLVARLMAKDPAERFQSAAEVAALLEGYLAHLHQPATAPLPAPTPLPLHKNGQGDTEMLLACSSCGTRIKTRAEQAGKKVKCPRCGAAVVVPATEPAPPMKASSAAAKVWLLASLGLGSAALALVFGLVLLGAWLLRPAPSAPPAFLEVALGGQVVAGVEETGFYQEESNDSGPFRWTDGKATLVIPLDKNDLPQALFVNLQRPKGTSLRITVNDRELFNEKATDQWHNIWEKTLDLTGVNLGEKITLEIGSNAIAMENDSRKLGVKVRVVKLLRRGNATPIATPPPSFLDFPLGNRAVAGVEDSGFHKDGQDKLGPFRWTNGQAKLVIPLEPNERPKALWVLLHRPRDRWVRITLNQRELVNEKTTDTEVFWWERTLDLSGIEFGAAAVLEIASNASATPNDGRQRGVKVREIKLLREKDADNVSFVDVPLGGRFVRGIKESGFLEQGTQDGQPARWTDGSARMTVPLGGKKPRTLSLTAYIPSPPGCWVKVTVNGKKLFDGKVKSSSTWSCELPLTGMDLGDSAHIEVDSPTFVPAQVDQKSKDTRVLGINVKRLVLLSDAAVEKK